LSPEIDLTAKNRSIVKADIQQPLQITRITVLVSNAFESVLSISYLQGHIFNGRV